MIVLRILAKTVEFALMELQRIPVIAVMATQEKTVKQVGYITLLTNNVLYDFIQ